MKFWPVWRFLVGPLSRVSSLEIAGFSASATFMAKKFCLGEDCLLEATDEACKRGWSNGAFRHTSSHGWHDLICWGGCQYRFAVWMLMGLFRTHANASKRSCDDSWPRWFLTSLEDCDSLAHPGDTGHEWVAKDYHGSCLVSMCDWAGKRFASFTTCHESVVWSWQFLIDFWMKLLHWFLHCFSCNQLVSWCQRAGLCC